MWKFLALFARFYTPARFIAFIRRSGRKLHFLPKMLALFFCIQDKDTPKFVKLVLMGALGYVILPFDIMPDFLPFAGWLDDAAAVAAALEFASAYIKPEHKEKVKRVLPFAKCDW